MKKIVYNLQICKPKLQWSYFVMLVGIDEALSFTLHNTSNRYWSSYW